MKKINADPPEYEAQNNLGELELSMQHLDNFLKYVVNPKLSCFTAEEKLSVLQLYERMRDLLTDMRFHNISLQDRITEILESLSNIKTPDTSIN